VRGKAREKKGAKEVMALSLVRYVSLLLMVVSTGRFRSSLLLFIGNQQVSSILVLPVISTTHFCAKVATRRSAV